MKHIIYPVSDKCSGDGLLRLFRPIIPIVPVWSPGPIVSRHLMQWTDMSPYSIFFQCLHDHPCLNMSFGKMLLDTNQSS